MTAETRQHGVKGVFLGGNWVDIEDCGKQFNILDGSDCINQSQCSTCPRSRSKNSSVKNDGSYDVIIIGAGCIGGAIARELSKFKVSVLVLEAADDVTQGATKGNSGIVHAGFDDTPNTNRAKFCWRGNQMFVDLDNDLHFGYQKNGSLVLATNETEVQHLHELLKRGETNGVQRLRVINQEEVRQIEPHVNPKVIAALLSPDAGNLIPYEYTIALLENAVDNGVELRIRREVTNIQKPVANSSDDEGLFTVTCRYWEPASYIAATTKLSSSSEVTSSITDNTAETLPLKVLQVVLFISVILILAVTFYTSLLSNLAGLDEKTFLLYSYSSIGVVAALAVIHALLASNNSKNHKNKGSKVAKIGNTGSSSLTSVSAIPPVGNGGRKVTADEMKIGGSGSSSVMQGKTMAMETYRAKYIVNCAGSASDIIAKMIGDDSFKIKPRLGDYLLLNRNQGHLAKHTLFPCPGPLGKGVLVQTTLWGNLILGPTARDTNNSIAMAETSQVIQKYILNKCYELVPYFDASEVIHSFCGARAKSDRGDWIIEPSIAHPHFILAAGIDSPGLAGSPAIAIEIVRLLKVAGLNLLINPQFHPKRAPIIVPKDGWKGIKAGPVGKYTNPKENIVCKCEKVTEAEVVTALHRSLPIDSTQAVRKRTRAGMGFCQADKENYNCECRIAAIIARELHYDDEERQVGRRPWPATSILPQRWLQESEKQALKSLCEVVSKAKNGE